MIWLGLQHWVSYFSPRFLELGQGIQAWQPSLREDIALHGVEAVDCTPLPGLQILD